MVNGFFEVRLLNTVEDREGYLDDEVDRKLGNVEASKAWVWREGKDLGYAVWARR